MNYVYPPGHVRKAAARMPADYERDVRHHAKILPDGRWQLSQESFSKLHEKYKPRAYGLGGFVTVMIEVTGAKEMRRVVKKKPCNCKRHEAALNRIRI